MSRTKMRARKQGSQKRKREDNVDTGDASGTEPPMKRISLPQRPKQIECDESIAMMDPALLADHFAKTIRKRFPDSSSLEHEDLYLPAKAFRDTTQFEKKHIAESMPEFLEKFTPNGQKALKSCEEGAGPHTLVITCSGIRTTDVARALRALNGENSQVAKLIAKHMKLKNNITHMEKTRVGIAISTPLRFSDLLDAKALKPKDLKRIMVDGSYQDEKKRSIFEMEEIFQPLIKLLNRKEIQERYGEKDAVEILVF